MSGACEESIGPSTPMIEDEKLIKTSRVNQYLAGFAVSLGGFAAGTVLAWTSPALNYLIDDNTNTTSTNLTASAPPGFKITTSQQAFVGATLMIGGLLIAIPSGKCADLFGRKLTLMVISALYVINYIIIACASNYKMLVVARFIAGLALGGCCVVTPMYIGEIAEDSLKGILGSLFSVLLAFGICFVNVIGIFTNWVGLNVCLAMTSLCAFIAILFFPDTPVYLIKSERLGKAKKALIFFRKDPKLALDELTQLQKQSAEQEAGGTLIDLFTKRCHRKPLIAGLGVFIYQQLCGINVVVFYTVPIFHAADSNIDPLIAASTTNFIALLIGIVSVFVIEKRDRKYFLQLSAVSMLIGILGLGLFFQLKTFNVTFPGLQLLPISCVVLVMAGFAIGMGPVPWILLIELYSPEMRGAASGVNIVGNWMSAFFVTFSFPYFMELIGSACTFYLYGVINGLGILFVWFVVPETRNSKK